MNAILYRGLTFLGLTFVVTGCAGGGSAVVTPESPAATTPAHERLIAREPQPLGTTMYAAQLVPGKGDAKKSDKKPNILVIWGDDIGQANVSAYTKGVMGYRTPNIDSIAEEGLIFTDYYAEQSCTAGRSAFITGQSVFRTGLSKVGLPGADLGMMKEDPTIAGLLKNHGYVTGQFGKTTSATRTRCCRPTMASMSSTATFITSMRRKSLN